MSKKRKPSTPPAAEPFSAQGQDFTLRSWTVGALPLVNHILDRIGLDSLLAQHLPPDGPRMKIPTRCGILLMVRNILLSREPVYGLGEWALRHAPDLLRLTPAKLSHLNDDRIGRCLDRLFDALPGPLVTSVVRRVIDEFNLSLDELHNDSTTVTFHGAYDAAHEEDVRRGLPTLGITWGHNKDHRPDLKQLLYILTVTDDGGVPVHFTTATGNTTDDVTHLETWELMRQLVGRPDFLYVADCKLASRENLRAIDQRGGRFVTVLPRTRREDKQFRQQASQSPPVVQWLDLYEVYDDDGEIRDSFQVAKGPYRTSDGFRLLWYFSAGKKAQDAVTRARHLEKLRVQLLSLRKRLQSPKTRFRTAEKVREAVDKILRGSDVASLLNVTITEHAKESFRQSSPGRPGPQTKYVRTVQTHYDLEIELNMERIAIDAATDGVFPLVTNDEQLPPEEVLRAYKRQPLVEKRFSQFKHDFAVAPVYLKDVARIQALLCVYFFVLVVQTLLERELRLAMSKKSVEDLPLYPEGRPCAAPTTKRLIDMFEPVQRHELRRDGTSETIVTKLSSPQRSVLKLLGITSTQFGK